MFFRKQKKDTQSEFYIHLFALLERAIEFDADKLMAEFRKQWGVKIACKENPEWAKAGIRKYMLIDQSHTVLLSVSEQPLPKELLQLITENSVHNLDADKRSSVLNQKAHILIKYVMGDSSAMERVRFSVQTLLTLLHHDSVIGYGMYLDKFIARKT